MTPVATSHGEDEDEDTVPNTGLNTEADASPLVIRVDGRQPPRVETTVWVAPDPERAHLFDTTTGLRLSD